MMVIIRTIDNNLYAFNATEAHEVAEWGNGRSRVELFKPGQPKAEAVYAQESVESLVRRINQGRMGLYPAQPPEAE